VSRVEIAGIIVDLRGYVDKCKIWSTFADRK